MLSVQLTIGRWSLWLGSGFSRLSKKQLTDDAGNLGGHAEARHGLDRGSALGRVDKSSEGDVHNPAVPAGRYDAVNKQGFQLMAFQNDQAVQRSQVVHNLSAPPYQLTRKPKAG